MSPGNNQLVQAIELQQQGQNAAAVKLFKEVLVTDSNNAIALYSLAVIELNSGNAAEALCFSELGIKGTPDFAPLRLINAAALQALDRREDALQSYDKALEIDPNYVTALINSGALLRSMFRHREAVERFNHVVSLEPTNTTALANCGILLTEFRQSEVAIGMFKRLISINPDYDYALGLLLYEQLHLCEWADFDQLSQQIITGIRSGRRSCKSLAFMSISDSAEDHQRVAKIFAQQYCSQQSIPFWQGIRYKHKKIRLAYVSPDLREHPVGHLMAGVFERHDKSRFETFAISLGINDGSRLRTRMIAAFDHFIDAQYMGVQQIAQTMRDMEIDIVVDLSGYTSDSHPELFAYRSVPVQVNYLGYPGTMGTEFLDYILADRYVIPEDQQQYYNEKVVYLPDTYLPTDSGIKISEYTPTREECGLHANGVIFCSFSNDYKISPAVFAVWMRLLQQVPGSILWMVSRNDISQRNLRQEAEKQGVDPARLIFAGRVPLVEDHLARYRLADIFLDTHPYNAHTTAADALMVGLPVVTYMGNAFPARVAGSLLHAIGLPELIAYSLEEYEQIALRLVTTPKLLAEIKAKIIANKATYPLFDSDSFTQNLEAAYIAMWRQFQLDGACDALSSSPARKMANRENELLVTQGASGKKDGLVSSSIPYDENLVLAQDELDQGNLPQAEIYIRRYLSCNNQDSSATGLLHNLRRAYGFSESFELCECASLVSSCDNRYLLIKAWGYGFWSEVHHLVSQLLLAELIQRTPIILWGRNCLFRNADDINAFGHFFQEISSARIEDVPQTASIFPSKWTWANLYEENINKWEGEGSRLAAQYMFERSETLLVSDFYSTLSSIIPWIAPSSKYYGLSEDQLYSQLFQKYLKPRTDIARKVEDFYVRYMQGRPWVGVHIRGSDKIHESPNLAQTNAGYLAFIDRIVELNPTIGIFLLTDASPILDDFLQRYGERLLTTQATRDATNIGVHLSGHDGIVIGEEVLLDSLLAIKCDYFVGNQESNVSLAIANLRNWSSGFIFLLGEKRISGENLFLHKNHARPEDEVNLTAPVLPAAVKKKVLFYNKWHNGDVHMSRPYVSDLMALLGDCDFYYCHRNNPKLLADIENLTSTQAMIDADIMIDTWIGQEHFKGMSSTEMAAYSDTFPGCNFPSYYAVMRKVYESLNLSKFFKPIEYYLPTIDYTHFDIENIQAFFEKTRRPNVLICNNATMSGQAPEVGFSEIVPVLASRYPDVNFLISNNDGAMPLTQNIICCSSIINNAQTICDLNEISYISSYCGLIVGRSSGPYSFSITKDNMQKAQFVCICKSKNDSWFLENSTNISWTNNPSDENIILLVSNLINKNIYERQ